MEEQNKSLTDLLKNIDNNNDYNTSDTLEQYFYCNYILEY